MSISFPLFVRKNNIFSKICVVETEKQNKKKIQQVRGII